MQYNTLQYNVIHYTELPTIAYSIYLAWFVIYIGTNHAIQYNTIQYNTIQYNTIQLLQHNTIQHTPLAD